MTASRTTKARSPRVQNRIGTQTARLKAPGARAHSCFPPAFEVELLDPFAKLICAHSRVTRRDIHSCLEPALPVQITLQRTALNGSSSRMISTIWPRRRWKLLRRRNPNFEESRTRQGSRFWLRSRLTTRLARALERMRLERRPSGIGKLGIVGPCLEQVSAPSE